MQLRSLNRKPTAHHYGKFGPHNHPTFYKQLRFKGPIAE
jgi:hypothetical protein